MIKFEILQQLLWYLFIICCSRLLFRCLWEVWQLTNGWGFAGWSFLLSESTSIFVYRDKLCCEKHFPMQISVALETVLVVSFCSISLTFIFIHFKCFND